MDMDMDKALIHQSIDYSLHHIILLFMLSYSKR